MSNPFCFKIPFHLRSSTNSRIKSLSTLILNLFCCISDSSRLENHKSHCSLLQFDLLQWFEDAVLINHPYFHIRNVWHMRPLYHLTN